MNNILTAAGLLFGITTFFYSYIISKYHSFEVDQPISKGKQIHNKAKINELSKIQRKLFLFFLIYLFFAYILLPTSVEIILSSKLSFWKFDLAKTIFIVINFIYFCFVVIITTVICRVNKMISNYKEKID